VFRGLARDAEGKAAEIAQDAADNASLGISAAGIFGDALARNRLAAAKGALQQLDDAIKDLEAASTRWKKL
jgi:hypothetical protein